MSSLPPSKVPPVTASGSRRSAAARATGLSLVRGPTVVVRPPSSPTATRCWLDGDVLTDVLRAAARLLEEVTVVSPVTSSPPLADLFRTVQPPPPPPLAELFRLSPMAGRLNRAVGRHPGVADLHAMARVRSLLKLINGKL
jgi:hypothetical protein